jgi:ligand-binding sensor domain-containing protein
MLSTLLRVVACWLLIAGVVRAESVERSSVVTDYTATLWADADGHPVGAVSSIVQDRDGYLWVGSTAGLFRFDGVRFTPWNQLSDARLPATWVSSLLIAADGTLWVGFGDESTVAHIRGRSADVQSLSRLRTGRGHRTGSKRRALGRGGVLVVSPGRGPLDAHRRVERIPAAARPRRHVGAKWTPPRLDRARGVRAPRGIPDARTDRRGYVWSIGEDSNGRLWVTDTGYGFKVFERGRRPRAIADALGGGYRVMFDRSGHVWLGTIAEGLWRIRTVGADRAVVEKATLRSALFTDAVHSLFEDRDGNVWVGTTAGLHRLKRQLLQSIPTRALVSSVDATAPGGMWATTPYGISRLDLDGGVWTETQVAKTTELIRLSARDRNGTLWVTDSSGLGRLIGDHIEHVDIPREFGPRARLTFLVADPSDGVWMGDGVRVAHWNGRTFVPFAPVVDGATARDQPDRRGQGASGLGRPGGWPPRRAAAERRLPADRAPAP